MGEALKIRPSDYADIPGRGEARVDTSLAIAQVLELVPDLEALAPLRWWDRVAMLAEEVASALQGGGSLTTREAAQIKTWAKTWRALELETRDFWGHPHKLTPGSQEDRAMRVVLGAMLDGRPVPPWAYGITKRVFLELEGRPPIYSVAGRSRIR